MGSQGEEDGPPRAGNSKYRFPGKVNVVGNMTLNQNTGRRKASC